MNLETGVPRKQITPNFAKNEHFLPPEMFVFLKIWRALFSNTCCEIRPFALSPTNYAFWSCQYYSSFGKTDPMVAISDKTDCVTLIKSHRIYKFVKYFNKVEVTKYEQQKGRANGFIQDFRYMISNSVIIKFASL